MNGEPIVFISYATDDRTIAGAVCQALEQAQIQCFIAPRDVPAGVDAFELIQKAMQQVRVVVLILSEKSSRSEYVKREVRLALHFSKLVLPFRIEDIQLDGAMHFSLATVQWVDAFVPPLEHHVDSLVERVAEIVQIEGRRERPARAVRPTRHARVKRRAPWFAMGVAVAVLLGGAFVWTREHSQPSDAAILAAATQLLHQSLDAIHVSVQCGDCAAEEGSHASYVNPKVEHGRLRLTGKATAVVHDRIVGEDFSSIRGLQGVEEDVSVYAPLAAPSPGAAAKPGNANRKAPDSIPTIASGPKLSMPHDAPREPTAESLRAAAYVKMGQTSLAQQDYVAAENQFEMAVSLDPSNKEAQRSLVLAKKALER